MKKSRLLLWSVVITLSVTGIALHFLAGDDGDLPHPLNGPLREVHGVIAALAICVFGYFVANHAEKKFAKRKPTWDKQIWDGYLHFSLWLILIVSGVLLYYPQALLEKVGINVTLSHWYAGIILMGLFPLHFWRKDIRHYQIKRQFQSKRQQG